MSTFFYPRRDDLDMTGKARILNVYDEGALEHTPLIGGHGQGFIIDVDGKRILFDTGLRGRYLLHNMKVLGIEPDSIDMVVLSHGHRDHTGGLVSLLEERSETLVEDLDRRLAGTTPAGETAWRPLAALHYENSYTAGSGTLSHAVVEHAGLENLGKRLGLSGTVRLPLEVLILSAPDLVAGTTRGSTAPSLAYQAFEHPVLRAALQGREPIAVPDKYWVCGAPFTAEAVRILATAAAPLRARGPMTP